MAGKLTVFMVGTLAAVLKKTRPTDKFPFGVRILLPFAPQQLSRFDDHVIIPKTEPFIGVPWGAITNRERDKITPLFRISYRFPVMEGEAIGDPVDVAFFALATGQITPIEFESGTRFQPIDGPIGGKPTKETASYLSWVADMEIYSEDNSVVDQAYMNDSDLPGDAAVVEFEHGTFSVGRVGFEHQFRFINGPEEFDASIAPADTFDRTIADALKLSADVEPSVVRVTLNHDLVLELDGTNLSLLVGSEPLSHMAVTEPAQPCGMPLFHHELLYQFSETEPGDSDLAVPVCVNVRHPGKDPDLGHCAPPVFMTAPPPAAVQRLPTVGLRTPARALSLHVGVNQFSATFPSSTSLPAPSKLDSCVRDAGAMRDLATTLGFESLNRDGKNVLADTNATVSDLTQALKDYGQAAGPGSFFLLTFSGHAMPMQLGGGGWCLNTNVLLYSNLKGLLAQYFSEAARIMVISDCCFSGRLNESAAGVKELPMPYAAAFFSEVFVPHTFGEQYMSLTLRDKARTEESAQPPMYFVFACGNDETIKDGGKKHLSPFTECVKAYPHDPTVPTFEADLASCSKKSSHIDRVPSADPIWEQSEPFSMPPSPAIRSKRKSR